MTKKGAGMTKKGAGMRSFDKLRMTGSGMTD
jgi:hypothetical protein